MTTFQKAKMYVFMTGFLASAAGVLALAVAYEKLCELRGVRPYDIV